MAAESQKGNFTRAPGTGNKVYFAPTSGVLHSGPASLRNSYTLCLLVYPRPSTPKTHVPWTAAELLNYKAFLLPLSEAPTKFGEELQRLFGYIYNLLFTEEISIQNFSHVPQMIG